LSLFCFVLHSGQKVVRKGNIFLHFWHGLFAFCQATYWIISTPQYPQNRYEEGILLPHLRQITPHLTTGSGKSTPTLMFSTLPYSRDCTWIFVCFLACMLEGQEHFSSRI